MLGVYVGYVEGLPRCLGCERVAGVVSAVGGGGGGRGALRGVLGAALANLLERQPLHLACKGPSPHSGICVPHSPRGLHRGVRPRA